MEGNAKKYEYALEMIGITKEFPGVKALAAEKLKIKRKTSKNTRYY